MGFLEIILSSAVVVAVVNMIMQNKNNKLQYITNERSNWRKELKEISAKIQQAQSLEQMKNSLLELKNRINSYGQHFGEYPLVVKMDFLKDEHIWKIVNDIENEEGDFEKKKEKLLECIGLLLKFDWERAKSEVKPRRGITVSLILALIGGILEILTWMDKQKISFGDIDYGQVFSWLIWIMSGFFLLLLPYISENISAYKRGNWFRDTKRQNVAWGSGIIVVFFIVLINLLDKKQSYWESGAILFLMGAVVTIIVSEIEERNMYIDYFNKIVECMEIEGVTLYYYKNSEKIARAERELAELNMVSRYVTNIKLKLPEQYKNQKEILKKRYKIIFSIKKEKSVLRFIERYPRAMKPIAEYQGEFFIIAGKNARKKLKEKITHNL